MVKKEKVDEKMDYLFGLFLLFIGVLLILANFGLIEIAWDNLWLLFLLIPGIFIDEDVLETKKDLIKRCCF